MQTRLILIISLIIPLSLFSQNLKKAFKNLESRKYTEAAIIFNQAKDDMGTKSAAYFGLAKLESTKKRTGYDLFKAYEYIAKADKFASSMNPKEAKKISAYYSINNVKAERARIDNALFTEVKNKEDVALVDRFIMECEDSQFFLEVLSLKAELEYEKVKEYNTEKDYLEFINRFPESKDAEDAKLRLNQLAWTKAKSDNTIDSYTSFIKNNPEALQLDSANILLIDLEYQKTVLLNTVTAYTNFIDTYPESDQAEMLRAKREKLAYAKAKVIGSFVVYQGFINDYPYSVYAPEIAVYRDSLAFIEAKQLNTNDAYVDFVNAYPNAKEVPLAMEYLSNKCFSGMELVYMKKRDRVEQLHLKMYKAFRISPDDSSKIIIEKQVTYDTLGHQITYMSKLLDGAKMLKNTEYDNEGSNRLTEKIYINDTIQKEFTFAHFNHGLLKVQAVICFSDCGKYPAEYVSNFKYDSLRNLISRSDSALMDSSIIANYSYQYDTLGLVISETINYSDSSKHNISYKYNFQKKLMEKSTTDIDGKVLEVISYTYDNLERKLSMKRYDEEGVIEHKYTYGEKGVIEFEDIVNKISGESFRLSYQYEFF